MNNKQSTSKLINVCAWCGKEQYGVFDASAVKTHGICQGCLAAVLQDKGTLLQERV